MKIGMLTGLWFVADGATLIKSLRRAAALGFRYVDIHGVFHGGPAHLKPGERLTVKTEMKALVDLGHMALAREGPEELARVGDAIVHAHFSDHKPFMHTNQVIGTGFTRTKDYLDELRRMGIDQRVKRFGYDELVISFELGVPGNRIGDPEDWVKRSIQHIQQIAPDMTLA